MLLLGIYIGVIIAILPGAIILRKENKMSKSDWILGIFGFIFWPIILLHLAYLLMKDIVLSLKKNRA